MQDFDKYDGKDADWSWVIDVKQCFKDWKALGMCKHMTFVYAEDCTYSHNKWANGDSLHEQSQY